MICLLNSFLTTNMKQVLSRGNIVHSGSKHHHFKSSDFVDQDDDFDLLSIVRGPAKSRGNGKLNCFLLKKHKRRGGEHFQSKTFSYVVNNSLKSKNLRSIRAIIVGWILFLSFIFQAERRKDRRRRIKTTPLPVLETVRPTEVVLPDHVANFVLNVPINHEMSPLAKVLVFYVRDDGETVADSIHIPVQQCLKNKVHENYVEIFDIIRISNNI